MGWLGESIFPAGQINILPFNKLLAAQMADKLFQG